MFRELKLLKLIYQYHIEESEVRYEHVKGEVDDLEKKFKKVNEKVDAEDDDRRRRLCSMETPKKTKVSFPRFRGKNFENVKVFQLLSAYLDRIKQLHTLQQKCKRYVKRWVKNENSPCLNGILKNHLSFYLNNVLKQKSQEWVDFELKEEIPREFTVPTPIKDAFESGPPQ